MKAGAKAQPSQRKLKNCRVRKGPTPLPEESPVVSSNSLSSSPASQPPRSENGSKSVNFQEQREERESSPERMPVEEDSRSVLRSNSKDDRTEEGVTEHSRFQSSSCSAGSSRVERTNSESGGGRSCAMKRESANNSQQVKTSRFSRNDTGEGGERTGEDESLFKNVPGSKRDSETHSEESASGGEGDKSTDIFLRSCRHETELVHRGYSRNLQE